MVRSISRQLVCAFALFILPMPMVVADGSNTSAENQSSAISMLSKMANVIGASTGISFSSKLLILAPNVVGKPSPIAFDLVATVDKSGHAVETLSFPGSDDLTLYADGSSMTLTDPTQARYCKQPAFGGVVMGTNSIARCVDILAPGSADSALAFVIAQGFPDDFVLGKLGPSAEVQGRKHTVSFSKATDNGASVDVVTQSYRTPQGSFEVVYTIDPVTSLPVKLHEEAISEAGQTTLSFNEEFTKITLLTNKTDQSLFKFSPSQHDLLVKS